MTRARSSATWLVLAFALVVVYASLFPFAGWRVPPGGVATWLWLPWPAWFPRFDIVSNLLGYLPLGLLLYVAAVRSGWRAGAAFATAVITSALLSYTLEVLQQFLPARVPSLLDLVLNAAGATLGALAGAALHGAGLLEHWQSWRDRWFVRDSAGAIALLLLWPLGLLFPTPVPLGVGQVWDEARGWALAALAGTPWFEPAQAFLAPSSATVPRPSLLVEAVAVALGLLVPCLIAYTVTHPGVRRLALAAGAAAVAVGTMTLASAMNYGPDNALAWWTPAVGPGLVGGLAAAVLCLPLGRRRVAGVALVALTALVAIVAMAPTDPYYALNLQGWQQGRFIRFHGLAQWVGWFWPYVAMGWLLSRLGRAGAA
jgi:VanZ family protein